MYSLPFFPPFSPSSSVYRRCTLFRLCTGVSKSQVYAYAAAGLLCWFIELKSMFDLIWRKSTFENSCDERTRRDKAESSICLRASKIATLRETTRLYLYAFAKWITEIKFQIKTIRSFFEYIGDVRTTSGRRKSDATFIPRKILACRNRWTWGFSEVSSFGKNR